MEPILLNKSKEILKSKADFVTTISDKANWLKHRYYLFGLLIFTFIFFLGIILINTDRLITLKGILSVMLILTWLVTIIYAIWFFVNRQINFTKLSKAYQHLLNDNALEYFVFDEENLLFNTEDYKLELKWDVYTHYLLKDSIIGLYSSNKNYSFLIYTVEQIGQENFIALKSIAEKKLKLLVPGMYVD